MGPFNDYFMHVFLPAFIVALTTSLMCYSRLRKMD